jgi:tRNA U34 5-carboxymethylaminomethyl modifying GTPase MnmE/TrmE
MIARADLIVWMVDLTEPDWSKVVESDIQAFDKASILLVGNKIDECTVNDKDRLSDLLPISCISRVGIDKLRRAILASINEGIADMSAGQVVTSARHRGCLDRGWGIAGDRSV